MSKNPRAKPNKNLRFQQGQVGKVKKEKEKKNYVYMS
jgi:hypothetical protein